MNNKLFKSAWYHGSRTFLTASNEASVNVPTETPLFTETLLPQHSLTVQALASQGGEIALDDTFVFDIACSNQLMMSPSFCGSDPYPCGSLTYRT